MTKILFSTLFLSIIPQIVFAYSCDFIENSPQPDWIYSERSIEGYYVGVGVSSKSRKSSAEQIKISGKDAKRDLAENIQVTIQSEFKQKQTVKTIDEEVVSEELVESLTETASEASLKMVITDALWLDPNSCLLWTRVKVKKEIVAQEMHRQQQIVKISSLESLLDTVDVAALNTEGELNKLTIAQSMFSDIDFNAIKSSNISQTLSLRIDQMSRILEGASESAETAEQLFRDAAVLLTITPTNNASKTLNTFKALQKYHAIMINFPFNEDNTYWSEKAAFEIASIEIQRQNPCAASQEIEKVINLSRSPEWQLKAKRMRRDARCNDQARAAYNFRKYFDAKTVAVACTTKLTQLQQWNNVCDKIVTHFNSQGAIANKVTDTEDLSVDFVIKVDSLGEVNTRESAGNKEYQFKGEIEVVVFQLQKVLLQDRYSGIGGWNPISENMAMEVLGVHVYKRFINSLNQALKG